MKIDEDFAELYERELDAVVRAAYLLSGDRSIAEDAAQEAFARALARWGRLRQRTWAGGWVTTTALNVARRQLRGRRNAHELTSPRDRAVDVERVSTSGERSGRFRGASRRRWCCITCRTCPSRSWPM